MRKCNDKELQNQHSSLIRMQIQHSEQQAAAAVSPHLCDDLDVTRARRQCHQRGPRCLCDDRLCARAAHVDRGRGCLLLKEGRRRRKKAAGKREQNNARTKQYQHRVQAK
jgi:hypothetical protein